MAEKDAIPDATGVSSAPLAELSPKAVLLLTSSAGRPPGPAPAGLAEQEGETVEGRSRNLEFPQKILNIGFMAALVLAGISLVVGRVLPLLLLVEDGHVR